jgi:uncharacterized protein YkwD
VFAAGLLLTVVHGPTRAHADNVCTPDSSWGTNDPGFAAQVLTLVNQHRASIGVGQLTTDSALTASATWKSMNMAGYDYFDHNDDPIGRTVAQRLVACGWPSNLGWGENIAEGFSTPTDVMNAWLNSPGHKANIENPAFTSSGIGVAESSSGVYYWTQDFGQGSSGGGGPAPPPTTTTSSSPPPPPPPTTTAPATTTRPTTTAPVTTTPATTTHEATTTTAVTTVEAPKPARVGAAVPKVHKAKKARKLHETAKFASYVTVPPRGWLKLSVRHHL